MSKPASAAVPISVSIRFFLLLLWESRASLVLLPLSTFLVTSAEDYHSRVSFSYALL